MREKKANAQRGFCSRLFALDPIIVFSFSLVDRTRWHEFSISLDIFYHTHFQDKLMLPSILRVLVRVSTKTPNTSLRNPSSILPRVFRSKRTWPTQVSLLMLRELLAASDEDEDHHHSPHHPSIALRPLLKRNRVERHTIEKKE